MKQSEYEAGLAAYTEQLRLAERREATIRQYERAPADFFRWLDRRQPDKQAVIAYQEALSRRYCAGSVNTRLAPLNGFLDFTGRDALRVRQLPPSKKSPGTKGGHCCAKSAQPNARYVVTGE